MRVIVAAQWLLKSEHFFYRGNGMTTRTKRSIAHFAAPFRLHGLDVQPAGDYDIDEDKEMIEGLSWLAYQRVATFIHIPARNFDQRKYNLLRSITPN